MKRKVTILGAGLVGALLAILLKKKGYDVTIYERRSDMRKHNQSAGRSINMAMSVRGWKALEIAGLRSEIEKIAIPMYGRYLHQQDGTSGFQAYGKNREAIYSVSRGDLNMTLMNHAEKAGANIIFGKKCTQVDVENNIIFLQDTETGQEEAIQCDLLFGADGAFSALRTSYGFLDRTNFSQMYIDAGYKELCIPNNHDGSWKMEKNALHIWPRGKFMMIALPNTDGSFTCTLFFPFEGEPSFESVQNDQEINSFYNTYFADALPMMPTLINDYKNNPTSSLITIRILPWKYKDLSCLIGDAAHAIVPFYGQGMNAGFEDCSILIELMNQYGDNWEKIFEQYEILRQPNGDAVAELALDNFVEMRDKVADPHFLQRKKIEKELGRKYPGIFNSVYEMVSFTHTPYSFALACSKYQDELLSKVMSEGDFFENISNPDFEKKLASWMQDYEQKVEAIKHYR